MKRFVISAAVLAAVVLAPATARAELLHVQLDVLGMDWAFCAHAVSVAIKKLDGVESVDVSLDKASADIRLKAGNRITLQQLRQVIRKTGYPTKDAQVEARGRIVPQNGAIALDLLNGTTLEVADAPKTETSSIVTVTGVSRSAGKDRERLTISATR